MGADVEASLSGFQPSFNHHRRIPHLGIEVTMAVCSSSFDDDHVTKRAF
jgi:hypothetical protein